MQITYASPIQPGVHDISVVADVNANATAVILPNYFVVPATVLLSYGELEAATTLTVAGFGADGAPIVEVLNCAIGGAVVGRETTNKFSYVVSITNGDTALTALSAWAVGDHYIVGYPVVESSSISVVAAVALAPTEAATLDRDSFVSPLNVHFSLDAGSVTKVTVIGIDAAGFIHSEDVSFPAGSTSGVTVSAYYRITSITNTGANGLVNFVATASGSYYDNKDNSTFVTQHPYIILDTLFADGFNIQFNPLPFVSQDMATLNAGTTFTGFSAYRATGTTQPVYQLPKFSGSVTGAMTLTPENELAWPNTVTGTTGTPASALAVKDGTVYGTVYLRPLSAVKTEVKKFFGKLVVNITPFGA